MKHHIFVFLALISLSVSAYSLPMSYCSRSQPSAVENTLLQKLIPGFATEMNCEISNNCIQKWAAKEDSAKYSIAWKNQCGPIINGVYQLGDEGHGSTFVCSKSLQAHKTCCWPLGYDYASKWVVCSK